MDYLKNPKILIVIGAAVTLHIILAAAFAIHKSGAYKDHMAAMAKLDDQWRDEDAARKAEQEEQLVQKYGTTKPDRIAFDPRLNIMLGFEKLITEVVPVQFEQKVTVQRFTDFVILLRSNNLPDRTVLAGFLREIFSRMNPKFVYRFIITDGDRYYIVTREDLENVRDWKNADNFEIFRCCLKD